MALSIKTDEADHLARALAKLAGETITQAVTTALRERLDREQARLEGCGRPTGSTCGPIRAPARRLRYAAR
jgi:hypothetical protein